MTTVLAPFDYLVIVVYVFAVVGLGMFVAFRKGGAEDLFLGGRGFGWFQVGTSIWGTNVGPAFLIGAVGAAYSTGMVTANFEWLAWFFLALLGMVFGPYYLGLGVTTIPQAIRKRFGVHVHRALTVYVLYSVIVLWLGGTLYAGGVLLSQILALPLTVTLPALMIIATSFTMFGGLAAVVATDALQTVLIILGALTMTLIGLHAVGGLSGLVAQTPADYWKLFQPADSADYPWPAIILGYPIVGIWFWCTDQTIVQRLLGARDLEQAQKGALFAAFLKILPPLIFTIPGIICFVLFPGLADPDSAFVTFVGEYFPIGLRGLMVAVLVAALISTVDSGLNSFSTIFTLDVYKSWIRHDAEIPAVHIRRLGQAATVFAAVIAVAWSLTLDKVGSNIFELLQSLVGFLAPPMAALALAALFVPMVTARGALIGFVGGGVLCILTAIGSLYGVSYGFIGAWPHFLYLCGILFVLSGVLMIAGSLGSPRAQDEALFPAMSEIAPKSGGRRLVWAGWALLALIMAGLYIGFETLARRAPEGPWPSTVTVYRGSAPTLDGIIAEGEYDDATLIEGVDGWNPQFTPVDDPNDLSVRVFIKHDGANLYVAYDVTDDLIYGRDTPRWLPDENRTPHEMSPDGWPWFGDGVELLVNAEYRWSQEDGEDNKGNGQSWQMVASTHKSWLNGLERGGLMQGEPRMNLAAWANYAAWTESGAMEAAVRIKGPGEGSGYVIEWRVSANPCLEVSPGVFWSPEMGPVRMGLNLAVADLDRQEDSAGNWLNIYHENWWAGEKDKRTWLKQWGTMILHPDPRGNGTD